MGEPSPRVGASQAVGTNRFIRPACHLEKVIVIISASVKGPSGLAVVSGLGITSTPTSSSIVRRALLVFGVLLLLAAGAGLTASQAAAACGNPVACENALPGDPAGDWQIQGAGDPTIQGFATSMSVNVGQTETFKINTPSTNYHIDILRLGYYGGDGARIIQANLKPSVTLPQTQPPCLVQNGTGLIDCGNWSVSASWTVPSTAVSGLYMAHLVRDDSRRSSTTARSCSWCATTPATRRSSFRPLTRHGRPTTTTAATASTPAR